MCCCFFHSEVCPHRGHDAWPSSSDAPLCVVSDMAVGGVFQHHWEGKWELNPFFSKRLQLVETRYSTCSHELLTVYLALQFSSRALRVGTSVYTLTISRSCMLSRQSLITIHLVRSDTTIFVLCSFHISFSFFTFLFNHSNSCFFLSVIYFTLYFSLLYLSRRNESLQKIFWKARSAALGMVWR